MKFDLIYADPPWTYRDKCHSGKRGAGYKYPTMDLFELESLPIEDVASDNCLLAMWWVPPMPEEAIGLAELWGFELKTMCGLSWVKRTKNGKLAFGMGNWTRANTEHVLFATRGRPKRADAGVPQVIEAIRGAHSAKPDAARTRLERLMGPCARLELFARKRAPGWQSVGLDVDGLDVRESLLQLAALPEKNALEPNQVGA